MTMSYCLVSCFRSAHRSLFKTSYESRKFMTSCSKDLLKINTSCSSDVMKINAVTRFSQRKLNFLQFLRNCSTFRHHSDASKEEESMLYKDKLLLRGMLFHGYHGFYEEEKKLGQKFLVDVDAWLDLEMAGETDNLASSVSYVDVYRVVEEIVTGPSQDLVESIANAIARTTLLRFPQITAVRVKVAKPHVSGGVCGVVDCLGVEIFRRRP